MAEASGIERLHPRDLTWAALLGRWVDFARSALALPDDAPGRRLRRRVPDIIMLQAVWCSLGDLGSLPASERSLGLDRAALLIDKHAGALEAEWSGEALPPLLGELIADARAQLQAASGHEA